MIIAGRALDTLNAPGMLSLNATLPTLNATPESLEEVRSSDSGVAFKVGSVAFKLSIPGAFNVSNALPAIIIARFAQVDDAAIARGLSSLSVIPGRMERIDEGQNFTVFVDYAHEGESMRNVLETAASMRSPGGKIIVLLGAEGGGRDKAKRPIMGKLTGTMADYVVVSNVDPYDDDPQEILEDIARVAEGAGKKRGADLFVIEDRREGIKKALSLAGAGDIVLITGKGAEQSMVLGGKSLPWDDPTPPRGGREKTHSKTNSTTKKPN